MVKWHLKTALVTWYCCEWMHMYSSILLFVMSSKLNFNFPHERSFHKKRDKGCCHIFATATKNEHFFPISFIGQFTRVNEYSFIFFTSQIKLAANEKKSIGKNRMQWNSSNSFYLSNRHLPKTMPHFECTACHVCVHSWAATDMPNKLTNPLW